VRKWKNRKRLPEKGPTRIIFNATLQSSRGEKMIYYVFLDPVRWKSDLQKEPVTPKI
jgi:hypothetical protein